MCVFCLCSKSPTPAKELSAIFFHYSHFPYFYQHMWPERSHSMCWPKLMWEHPLTSSESTKYSPGAWENWPANSSSVARSEPSYFSSVWEIPSPPHTPFQGSQWAKGSCWSQLCQGKTLTSWGRHRTYASVIPLGSFMGMGTMCVQLPRDNPYQRAMHYSMLSWWTRNTCPRCFVKLQKQG